MRQDKSFLGVNVNFSYNPLRQEVSFLHYTGHIILPTIQAPKNCKRKILEMQLWPKNADEVQKWAENKRIRTLPHRPHITTLYHQHPLLSILSLEGCSIVFDRWLRSCLPSIPNSPLLRGCHQPYLLCSTAPNEQTHDTKHILLHHLWCRQ